MHVENAVAERADGRRNVHSLPEQVARIEIDADSRAGGGAQLQHRVHVVDQKSGMRLEREVTP